MQYRSPVGGGPSGKTCPRWASHDAHRTSVRTTTSPRSLRSLRASPAAGEWKLGHPVPESNFASESKRAARHTTHRYVPGSFALQYAPVKAGSVPHSHVTRYCSGVSFARSASGVRPTRAGVSVACFRAMVSAGFYPHAALESLVRREYGVVADCVLLENIASSPEWFARLTPRGASVREG